MCQDLVLEFQSLEQGIYTYALNSASQVGCLILNIELWFLNYDVRTEFSIPGPREPCLNFIIEFLVLELGSLNLTLGLSRCDSWILVVELGFDHE